MKEFAFFGDDYMFYQKIINNVPLEDIMLLDLHSKLGLFHEKEFSFILRMRKDMAAKIGAINGFNKLLKGKDGEKYEALLKERKVLNSLEELKKDNNLGGMFQ